MSRLKPFSLIKMLNRYRVAQARGVILYLAQKHGCDIYEFGPQEIKVAITGYGKSDKMPST